jgi:serine/threonine-protein kinase
MGTVYLAENTALGTKWAIKAVKKSADVQCDFLAEPNILKKLNHPLLPRIVDVAEDSDNYYIVMDYIEGTGLNKILAGHRYVDEKQAIAWCRNLCSVLEYLHSQQPPIIYRDMKPSNIIITPDNTAKVIDFGISREYKAGKSEDTKYMGTHGYAPPEQWGIGQTDQRTDIYSLGVTVYQMLTGKSPNEPPYEFKPLRQMNSALSEGIEYIVDKCIQPDPVNRYQSVAELLFDIDNIYLFNSAYKRKRRLRKCKIATEVLLLLGGAAVTVYGAVNIPSEQNEVYSDCVDKGYAAIDEGDFDGAEKIFDTAAEFRPQSCDAYLGKAQIYLKQNDTEGCEKYLTELSDKYPQFVENPEFSYTLGTVCYDLEDYESAAAYIGEAVENDDENNVDYIRDLAVTYAKLGDTGNAEKYLDKLDDADIEKDINCYISGQLLESEGDYEGAVEKYEEALKVSDSEDIKYKCYKSLSDVYLELRHTSPDNWEYIKAQIDVLERAQKDLENKNNLVLTEALAEAYYTGQRYDMAISEYKELINMGYSRDYIYRNLAIIYQGQNDFDSAKSCLEEMKEKFPDSYTCYIQLCYLVIDTENQKPKSDRDYSEVEEYYGKAVELAPEGENDSQIIQLTAKVNELKDKGWL